MISRYTPKGRSQGALKYFVQVYPMDVRSRPVNAYTAYDSATSALIASAETLESLAEKCAFLGYSKAP